MVHKYSVNNTVHKYSVKCQVLLNEQNNKLLFFSEKYTSENPNEFYGSPEKKNKPHHGFP